MRVLGLDVGDRRIGIAVSDPTGLIASPVGAIQRRDLQSDAGQVLALATQHGAERIVVGLPVALSGESGGMQLRQVREFIRALKGATTTIRIDHWDERFSTSEAERRLLEAGVSASRDPGRLDAAAATVILQAYLERINRKRE